MQQWIAFSCCCVLCAALMSVEGFYLPDYRTDLSFLNKYERWRKPTMVWRSEVKRSNYDRFMDTLAQQAQRRQHRDRHAFVEEMFRLFDINRDGVISRSEFRAILTVMGIVPSSRMYFG